MRAVERRPEFACRKVEPSGARVSLVPIVPDLRASLPLATTADGDAESVPGRAAEQGGGFKARLRTADTSSDLAPELTLPSHASRIRGLRRPRPL